MLDPAIFQRTMTALSTLPQGALTDDRLDAYYLALADLPDDVFTEAAIRCLRECRFFPAPVEIRERAEEVMAARGDLPAEPHAAWATVERLARRWSPYTAPALPDDPALQRAVADLGGLGRIAMTDATELRHLRREFIARYTEYRRRALADRANSLIRGLPGSSLNALEG